MKVISILVRLLVSPFYLCMVGIMLVVEFLKMGYQFVAFGGEVIAYRRANQRKAISDIYDLLEEINNEE